MQNKMLTLESIDIMKQITIYKYMPNHINNLILYNIITMLQYAAYNI